MNKHLLKVFISGILFTSVANAQNPTWANDIAPILYKNCTSCHHPGGLAPNSLMNYTEAFNYRTMIQSYVASNTMPPWPPDAQYRHLAFERILSQADKDKISQWVTNGAPSGDVNTAPAPPTYTNTASQLGSIDFTGKMPDYTVNTSEDLYQCFVINTNFTADKFASQIEVKPGNSSIVHHVLVFEDTAQAIVNLDNADPAVGYTNFYGTGSNSSRLVGEWVPGTAPIKFPDMMGVRLRKNTRIILQVHYPRGTFSKLDSTRVNIKFAANSNSPFFREVFLIPFISESNLVNGPLTIPPNVVKTFTASATVTPPAGYNFANFTLLSVAPHMHLLGRSMKVFEIQNTPTKDTIPYISIPKWDFKWQGIYNFRNPLKVPTGSTIIAQSAYDNTASNPSNPNTPPITVNQGEGTSDEMMLVFAAFTYYFEGDENIVVDDSPVVGIKEIDPDNTVKTVQLYQVFPNPAKNQAEVKYYSPENTAGKAKLYSVEGKLIREWNVNLQVGFGNMPINLEGLSKGQYFINLETKSYTKTRSFIVND